MSEPTRILLDLTPVCSRVEHRTGLARVALSLAEALAARSDIELSTCAWGSLYASMDYAKVGDVHPELQALPVRFSPLEQWYLNACEARKEAGLSYPSWLIRSGQLLNILRNPFKGASLAGFRAIHSTYARFTPAIRRIRLPRLITVHDLTPFKLPSEMMPSGQRQITRRILDSISAEDWVVCVSEHTRNDFLEAYKHPEAQTVVIPNGVDLERFKVSEPEAITSLRASYQLEDCPYLMTLSSLAAHKNLRKLIDWWPQVKARVPEARLLIAGGKTRDIQQVRSKLGCGQTHANDGIQMTGFLDDSSMAGLLSGCNAFLFPSLYEGFGLPVLEAMACGASIIASNRSSIPEVYGSVGLGLDPDDPSAWVEAMVQALEKGSRTEPNLLAREHAESFSWKVAAERYHSVYSSLR